MGRKKTAEDYNRMAEQNGWVPLAHEEEDRKQHTKDDPSGRYKANQQEALDQWKIFLSRQGIDTSDCLQEGCPPPSNVLLKDFARWYTKSRRGRISGAPNQVSLRNIMKKFYSGFQRVTGTVISQELKDDVYYWIRNVLLKEGHSTTQKRDKYLFDVDDLVNVIVTLWTEDDCIFIHEVMREQLTFLILAYCFTGARVGAFLENGKAEEKRPDGGIDKFVFEGLTWRDVHVYLFPLPDGTTEVVVKLVQRWTKNNKDPEHTVNEIPTYEHGKLRFDITAFLLPLAFRDDVFIGISSPAELWDFRVPEGEDFLELRMHASKMHLPVLRIVTRHGGLSDKMLNDSTFRYYFQRIIRNAGYWGELTIHSLRRAVANAIDETATPGERNKVLGWASSDVGDREYISSLCRVPVQDKFLRNEAEKPHDDHVRKLRSVRTKRAIGLPQALPAKETDEVLNDPTAIKLYQELWELREQGASSPAIDEAHRKFRTYHRWLNTQALARWKEKWLDDRYQQIIRTRGRISNDRTSATYRTEALFRVMPERARLAQMMKFNGSRTREQRLMVVEDMTSLCKRNFDVLYRPGEEPVDGACPVCRSKLPDKKPYRAKHIHACRRREFAAKDGVLGRVHYCFLCFAWFAGAGAWVAGAGAWVAGAGAWVAGAGAWEEHCRGHLVSMSVKWCAIRVYSHTLISPAICPCCVTNENLTAAMRLRQWERNCELMDHIDEDHINKVSSWPTHCGCCTELEDRESFRYHLSDEHGLWKAEWKAFCRKRGFKGGEDLDVHITD